MNDEQKSDFKMIQSPSTDSDSISILWDRKYL